jgi:hypothetical protein
VSDDAAKLSLRAVAVLLRPLVKALIMLAALLILLLGLKLELLASGWLLSPELFIVSSLLGVVALAFFGVVAALVNICPDMSVKKTMATVCLDLCFMIPSLKYIHEFDYLRIV